MDAQRLRNLTTRILHTEIDHVYKDIKFITGSGIMTHMIPRMLRAVEPWLREHVADRRFWDGKFDTTHEGEIDLPNPTQEERELMIQIYKIQPDPLEGTNIIEVISG